jgi:8-oxo-dGDP phosphatase
MRGGSGGRPPGWQQAGIRDQAGSWPVTESSVLARGRIVTIREDLVRLPDGKVVGREVVEHPGAVAVVALDERDRVLLIRQYRHPVAATLWEIPAGLRDVDGEPLVETARRELAEEAGYQAADWRVLADFLSSPGISTERLRVFLARDLTVVPAAEDEYVRQHEEAYLTVAWVPLDEVVRGILSGDLHNGVAMVGVLSAYAARAADFRTLRQAGEPEDL